MYLNLRASVVILSQVIVRMIFRPTIRTHRDRIERALDFEEKVTRTHLEIS